MKDDGNETTTENDEQSRPSFLTTPGSVCTPRMTRSSSGVHPVTLHVCRSMPASRIEYIGVGDVVTLIIEHDAWRAVQDRLVAIDHDESQVVLRGSFDHGR